MKKHLAAAVLVIASIASANAAPVSLTQTANITQIAQNFSFQFNGLQSSNGGAGQFVFKANGDYDPFSAEDATINFDGFGQVVINASSVVSNSVLGLSLNSFITTYPSVPEGWTDYGFTAVFDVSSQLLNSLLADLSVNFGVQNGQNHNPLFANGNVRDPDFLQVALNYQTAESNVPEPGSLVLLGLGLAGLGVMRRKTKVS